MYAAAKASCMNAIIKTIKFPLDAPSIESPCQAVITLTKIRYVLNDLTLSFTIFLPDLALTGSKLRCRHAKFI
ncbi:hypothetical protein D3C85_1596030 [compost metagenome]